MHLMELVHIDFLTVGSGKGDKEINILVVTDHFIRYAQAYLTPSQTAKVIAQTLWDKNVMYYELQENILVTKATTSKTPLFWSYVLSHKSRSFVQCQTGHKLVASVSTST